MNPARIIPVSMLVAACLWLAACSSLRGDIEPPRVSLNNVQLVNAGLIQQTFRLTLRVQNPNGIPIPIRGMNYAVKLSGNDFASGVTPRSFTLPASGEEMVDIDVTTNILDVGRQLMRILETRQQDIDYSLSGKVQVDLPFVKALPFSRAGTVNLNYGN